MRPLRPAPLLLLAACAGPADKGPTADSAAPLGEPVDLLAQVDPRISTGGIGYNVGSGTPAASTPLALAKPGPDTSDAAGWDFGAYRGGGYHYDDVHVQGFSNLHLHGVGLTDYGLVSFMPVDGMDAGRTTEAGYRAVFSHADESVRPGAYDLTLASPDVAVQLRSDGPAALHRYTFGPAAAAPTLLLDLGHVLGEGRVLAVRATLDPATGALSGWMTHDGEMAKAPITTYFEGEVRPAPVAVGRWRAEGALEPGEATLDEALDAGAAGDGSSSLRAGLWMEFAPGAEVTVTVGLSFTDADGAALNQSALPADPDAWEDAARAAWAERLAPLRVWGGSDDEQRIFATALYHSLLLPTQISDRDGRYRGFDDAAHPDPGHPLLTDLSLWDTYRTTHPLYLLLWPDVQRASLNSLLRNAEQGGGVPRWPLATWEGGFMVGAPGHVIAAESVLKGLGGWEDAALIQQAVDEALGRVRPPYSARPDPDGYPERGYLSEEISGTSVAWTQELCLADHGLARAARALGLDPADADELERRSGFWANLYNPETGFFQARTPDGAWIPLRSESAWDDPFSEGNARQYLWMVPHDPEGLMQTLGPTALDRLTEFFDEAALDAVDDIRGVPEEWYWHGNEIDLHAPWLFSYLGRPDLTRRWVRWVMDTWYKPTPDGLAGNDDGGTLSAWYVWAALGLYPMAGTDVYVVGWPAFDRIELDRPGGGPLVITRSGDGLADGAEVELRIDGEPAPGLTLDHATLAAAAALEFRAR